MGHHSKHHKKCDKPKKCEKPCEKKCEKKCRPKCDKPKPAPLDCNTCKQEYDTQVKPILDVALDGPFEPFIIVNDGTFAGFDVDLITAIAERLPCVNFIRFTNYDFASGEVFFAVTSGDADILADSANSITQARISSGFVTEGQVNGMGAVATTDTRQTQLVLFFRTSADPDSADQVIGTETDPEEILRKLADAGVVVTGLGNASIQNATLRFYGVTISDAPDQGENNPLTALCVALQDRHTCLEGILDDQTEGAGGEPGLGAFLSNLSTTEEAETVLGGPSGTGGFKFLIVNLAPTVIARAGGYFTRDDRCKLLLQVQKILDQLIAEGVYQQIVDKNKALYEEGSTEFVALDNLVAPTKCLSVLRHYIPKTCSDSCYAKACDPDKDCPSVPHTLTVLPPLPFSP